MATTPTSIQTANSQPQTSTLPKKFTFSGDRTPVVYTRCEDPAKRTPEGFVYGVANKGAKGIRCPIAEIKQA